MWQGFKAFIVRCKENCFNSLGFLLLLFFASFAFVFYLTVGQGAVEILVEQTLHREQLATRSGAASMETFLNLTGASLALLARSSQVSSFQPAAKGLMEDYLQKWSGSPMYAVILVDKNGLVGFDLNREQIEEFGVSVVERKYFIWAKTAKRGEIYVSEPVISKLGATKGKYILPMATPVYDDSGNFRGALVGVILISRLAEEYLNPLKISPSSEVFLLEKDGTLIYSSYDALIGKNVFTILDSEPFLGAKILSKSIKAKMEEKEGKIDSFWPNEPGRPLPLLRKVAAYTMVTASSRAWALVLTTPVKDTIAFLGPLYVREIVMIVISFLILLLFSVRFARLNPRRLKE